MEEQNFIPGFTAQSSLHNQLGLYPKGLNIMHDSSLPVIPAINCVACIRECFLYPNSQRCRRCWTTCGHDLK